MTRSFFLLMTALAAGLLTSCATSYKYGMPYASDNVSEIIIGKTSESDVLHLFGNPFKTGIINGHIVYTYCYEEIVFHHDDTIDQSGNTLIIEFDEQKHVLNYYYNVPGKGSPWLGLILHQTENQRQEEEQAVVQSNISTIMTVQ